MLIAVSSQNRRTITGHAGKCRRFLVYQVEDNQVTGRQLLELPLEQTFHGRQGHGPHLLDGVNALISGGMGSGLYARLRQRGIDGLVTDETDPDRAVAAYLEGRLATRPPELHHGHDHRH